jgi:outer membrane protein
LAREHPEQGLPATPIAPLAAGASTDATCAFGALPTPLRLFDAVTRALCANAKTRQSWATIQLKAASVRVAKEGYLPNLGVSAKELHSDTQTLLSDAPELNTSANSWYGSGSLTASWLLLDFGARGAELESARQLLAAARAELDATLQKTFLQTAADYYDAQAAQASVDAAQRIEELTQRSVSAAHTRVDKGVAPVSDELQAQTAHAQSVVNRVRAEADLKAKRGALATDMGLDPDQPLGVPQADLNSAAVRLLDEPLRELIEQAKREHPSVVEAQRALAAAEADERAARVHGYPTLSLVAGATRSNEPLTPSLGSPTVPGSVRNKSIGVQIDVPISDALWKRGIIAQARAQVRIQKEMLAGTEQQVAQDVWNSYIALQADIDNLANSQALLESAAQSYQATQRRYEGGVGNILELLSSQSAFDNAQQQRIRALSDWRIARLALGASLGRLDLRSAQD